MIHRSPVGICQNLMTAIVRQNQIAATPVHRTRLQGDTHCQQALHAFHRLGMKGFSGAAGSERRPPIPNLGLGLRLPPQTPRGLPQRTLALPAVAQQETTGSTSQAAEDSQLRNVMKPPRLNLGVTTGDSEASTSPKVQPTKASGRKQGSLTIDLLSHALALDTVNIKKAQKQGMTVLDSVRQRCSGSLGVAVEELRFFEVRELSADEEPSEDCTHIAVTINRSGTTDTALFLAFALLSC